MNTTKTFALLSALLLSLAAGCGASPDGSLDDTLDGSAGQTATEPSDDLQPADLQPADPTDQAQEDPEELDERGITYNTGGTSPSGASGANSCWRKTTQRGAGAAPTKCGAGKELDQGLCYPLCKVGFKGSGPVCWSTGTAAPYNRGVGVAPSCAAATPEMDAGLCYTKCAAGYVGVGPVCWQTCPASQPVDCGGACSASQTTCATLLAQQISAPIITLAQPQMTLAMMLSSVDTANAFNLPQCGE